jgi:hypothetical protein
MKILKNVLFVDFTDSIVGKMAVKINIYGLACEHKYSLCIVKSVRTGSSCVCSEIKILK